MTDPITAAVIVGLAVSKFTEGVAGEAGKKLVNRLWEMIAARFKGRGKVEDAIKQIEASGGDAPQAEANLVRVLDGAEKQLEPSTETREKEAEKHMPSFDVVHCVAGDSL